MKKTLLSLLCLAVATLLLGACTEKESTLGMNLQDPATIYDGQLDTAYGVYYTVLDDSLLTSGQAQGLVGCYHDDLFGDAEAVIFAQIAPPNESGVEFDQYCFIDSVVLSLAISDVYNPSGAKGNKGYKRMHFEVYQLAEPVMTDTAYYSFDQLAVSNVCLFNKVVRVPVTDTLVVSLPLDNSIISLFSNKSYATADEFIQAAKGLRIRLVNDGEPVMATVNFAASATRLSVYYTYNNVDDPNSDSIYRSYDFVIGNNESRSAAHFNQYINHYNGPLAMFNSTTTDSLDGAQYAYLSPMGGTNIKADFNTFVQQFHQDHPYATIHYAEMLLPVADVASPARPDMIAAFKCYIDGEVVSIPDIYDPFTYSGFDGGYDPATGCYRLRITQHLQKMLNSGQDLGTLLVLNNRRASAAHTVINGYNSSKPASIRFVYSE
ncbi:MAG: DUF4270 domain-containing protein [Bacteroidales bacterium]|nr:DUF4270 domain-containing protein [Bacteroidales bacterium]